MRIARVFPHRTRATPIDELAFVGNPPMGLEVDEVHVSCTFTYDWAEAERLATAWEAVASVRLGGPASDDPGQEFRPGVYLRQGHVITSRGCPNRCWFCMAAKRAGHEVRELPIAEGWIVQDDNLLACSERHVRSVFAMLKRQPHKAEFSGGLEAMRLEPWHVDLLADLKPAQMFFAYDTPDDYEPLARAVRMLQETGFNDHHIRVFVLIGYPNDRFEKAEKRLSAVLRLGVMPFAMLYRDEYGLVKPDWRSFQRVWVRPAAMRAAISGGPLPDREERCKRSAQKERLPL